MIADYNFMADILFLPTTKEGFKYCLVIVDLANDEFDIEPMKTKTSQDVLTSMLKIFGRTYIKKPEASITTDDGSEFKGVFHKWLYNESIYHKIALPARHSQLANVDSLCKQLGRLFNGYMNKKELETKKTFREWTDILVTVRTELNKFRKKKLPTNISTVVPNIPDFKVKPKFEVGDEVYRLLDSPKDALGNKQSTSNFRVGDFRFDTKKREIIKVITMAGTPTYRYMLVTKASYTENQLREVK